MRANLSTLLPLIPMLAGACAVDAPPIAPASGLPASVMTTPDLANLTDELPRAMWSPLGVSDSGWVFAWTSLGNEHVIAWRSLADTDTITVLSSAGSYVRSGVVSGRGDFLHAAKTLWVLSPAGGAPAWTGIPVTLPSGWVANSHKLLGLNDHATVVGYAQHPARSVTGRKGTTYYATPIVWTPATGVVALPIPAAPAGCAYTSVIAESVNDAGIIVGSGEQSGSSKAKCVTRALVWRTWSTPADTLPRTTETAGLPAGVKLDQLRYSAIRVNDAGDIGGYWDAPGGAASLRWVAPAPGAPYGRPEVLTGSYRITTDMDECGRILYREGTSGRRGVWDRGGKLTPLEIPTGYQAPGLESLRQRLAVMKVDIIDDSNNNGEILVWPLEACGPG